MKWSFDSDRLLGLSAMVVSIGSLIIIAYQATGIGVDKIQKGRLIPAGVSGRNHLLVGVWRSLARARRSHRARSAVAPT
jgi:hypothetical protein